MDDDDLLRVALARAFLRTGSARSVRRASGLSLREMAAALGVQPSTVMRWESQQRVPKPEAALRYKALLDKLMSA